MILPVKYNFKKRTDYHTLCTKRHLDKHRYTERIQRDTNREEGGGGAEAGWECRACKQAAGFCSSVWKMAVVDTRGGGLISHLSGDIDEM